MDEILKDARFAHIPRDPAFKRIPKREKKVKIDKRFQSMFSDKKFKVKFTVDKRGRPIQNSSTENLRRYYALDSSDESDDADDDEAADQSDSTDKDISETEVDSNKTKSKKKGKEKQRKLTISEKSDEKITVKQKKKNELEYSKKSSKNKTENSYVLRKSSSEEEEDEGDSESDVDGKLREQEGNDELDTEFRTLNEKVHARLQDLSVDYARGEGVILSDSSSDEESSDEDNDEDIEHGWGELDQDAGRTDESTNRLAVCNMDWDRITASDLMVLFSSFLPKGGIIHSVTVYPSEYGLQRMKEEEEKGPLELRAEGEAIVVDRDAEEEDEKKKRKKPRDDNEVEEGDEYQREKLRQYQLNRLRYFYAVVECDSVATADSLYKECDGMEYESSASHLDLRFVPDDTTFDQEPREVCNKLPNLMKYDPELFITTALQQSKVRLTWDETDPRRVKFNQKINTGKVDNLDENDLKVYLATSSSEGEASEEEGDEKKESAAKYRALLESINSQESAKKEKDMEMQVTWGIDLEDKVKKRMKEGKQEELTPFQKYVEKRKEKRRAKREEQLKKKQQQREGVSAGESEGEGGAADSGSGDDVPSDIDMNDAYFKEEFDKEEFAHTKKESKNKKNKKKKKGAEESEDEETKRKKAELELLLMDEDDNKRHFSLKDILIEDKSKTKKKKDKRKGIVETSEKKDDDFQINVQDQRFSALFTSHLYNIDPADPHYKKTKGMEVLRQEKLHRRTGDEEVPGKKQKLDAPEIKKKTDTELSLLVKNVKKKAQTLKR